ncbi:GNAT family N-acetyltransferase [Comamonas avium]|uniref:GNAT family N-acetyltransferase n=1 Tax=Comamonas avium TaxID=2762231 RepID=A0ABR8S6Y0_9BURK|nr:GNAT family N-acetyltransferase [Comamonas avium]
MTRLYVDPEYRKLGLATQLVKQLKLHAIENHADTLYLHTHSFLSGGLIFWNIKGFELLRKLMI